MIACLKTFCSGPGLRMRMVRHDTCHGVVLLLLPIQRLGGGDDASEWIDAETLLQDAPICHLSIGAWRRRATKERYSVDGKK